MSFNSGIIALSDLLTYNNSVTNGVAAFQFPQTSPPGAAATLGGGDFEEANNPHWKDPTSAQWNLTVEREVTPNTTVRLSYTGQGGYHLPITVDLNQIPASTTPYTIPNNGYSVVDPRAPYQNWNLLMDSESIGTQSYQAGTVELQHRVSRGLTFQANYTFVKNISDAQGSDAPTAYAGEEPYAVEIANRFNIPYDRGNVVGTPRQRVLLTGAYQLPFGAGQALQGPRFVNSGDGRLDCEHGYDATNRPVADAYDAGGRRSIEHQYDRAKHRRGHCAAGLRGKPIREPDFSRLFQHQCLRSAASQRRTVWELRRR